MDTLSLTLIGLILQSLPTGIPAWAFAVFYGILLLLKITGHIT